MLLVVPGRFGLSTLYIHEFCRRLVWWAYVPSIATGLSASAISFAGVNSFGTGLLGASLTVSVMVATLLLAQRTRWKFPLVWASLTLMLALNLNFQSVVAVKDGPAETSITQGPYRGLLTSQSLDGFLTKLSADVEAFKRPGGRVYFHHWLPAGYLLTRMRLNTPSVWTCPNYATNHLCSSYLESHLSVPSVVVLMKSITSPKNAIESLRKKEGDPLLRVCDQKVELKVSRREYDVYSSRQ